ncbi:MAG TPA: hypothetical protein VNH44_13960 [Micropepsaceae bacterium]|nr:hypothetical protein [Micropepsaceae bacterium]
MNQPGREAPGRKARLNFGRFSIPIPASRAARVALGIALCLGGLLGFLPILGFWMFPLGLLVLSIDLAPVRRWRRRLEVRWGRRKKRKNGA